MRFVVGLIAGLLCAWVWGQGIAGHPSMIRDRCESDPKFAWIPSGFYISGSDRAERDTAYLVSAQAAASSPSEVSQSEQQLRQVGWFDREPGRQRRSLPGFCLSRNLVTNADYQVFVQATQVPGPQISAAEYQAQGFLVHPYDKVGSFLWQGDQYPAGEGDHPVVLVSEGDAVAFAQWLGKQGQTPGARYRLPTAAEWEKAARGNDGRAYAWGNDWRPDATNWAGSGRDHTSPVGAYPLSRSPYGVEDMAGNVFEYTSTHQGMGAAAQVVMKGCSWDDLPGFCRAAYRHLRPSHSRHILFGFRLVKELG
jgi:toxoflavin biosynthesis protein ToxD